MTADELALALELFPALATLPPAELETLRSRGMVRALPAGTAYLREGDSCAAIALLLQGRIRVAKTSATGREITLYHIDPGETCILTAGCLLAHGDYPAQAIVVEDATAVLLPGDLFRRYVATNEAFRGFVIGHFSGRLASAMALVQEVAFARMDRRVASWLAQESQRAGDGSLALSHEEIAGHLGTARVVVSRVLESLESKGWIALGRRRVEIRDAEALAKYGNQSD